MNNLIKNPSQIDGIGIFTNKDIKKDDAFYEVPMNFLLNKPKPKCAHIGNNIWVLDEEVLNYVNHSCSPNSTLDISAKPRLIARRDIKSGEEITVDYNQTETGGIKIPCNCKTPNCKGYFLRKE